jgi:hypothetical protein
MKLVMTLTVRDEADILEANLDFHLAHGVDHVIATDNLSCDGSSEILRSYEARNVLSYLRDDDDTYPQSAMTTRMARLAAGMRADWVINADVDEFWYPHHGDLKAMLASVPARAEAAAAPVLNFAPVAEPGYFADVMTVRHPAPRDEFGDPLRGKVCHRALAEAQVLPGSHIVRRGMRVMTSERAPISILHFPARSYAQFERKIATGGAAMMRRLTHPLASVLRLARLYEMQQRGDLRALYDGMTLSDAAIAAGLQSGALLRDERLRTALDKARQA